MAALQLQPELKELVTELAKQGFGWQDVVVKLQIPNVPLMRVWVREIVMNTRAEYRGWCK